MSQPARKHVATRVTESLAAEIDRVAKETGLKPAEILRIGVRRLLDDYAANGTIQLGRADR